MQCVTFLEKVFSLGRLIVSISFLFLLTGCGLFSADVKDRGLGGADDVLETAYSQIGTRYKYGAASPKNGFDCSGFVYWVYKENGYKIPRMTSGQIACGYGVSRKKARKGDIVVFKTSQSPTSLHSGIYVGKNSFIHSPSKGKKVKVDKMNNSYWKGKLVAVRRVIEQ